MVADDKNDRLSVVIAGSFRKHFNGIREKVREFEDLSITVLSPEDSDLEDPDEEFVILETDESDDPKTIEQQVLDYITEADALYIYNPDGYMGDTTTLEYGWALAKGTPVFVKEEPDDVTLSLFYDEIASPEEIKEYLSQRTVEQSA